MRSPFQPPWLRSRSPGETRLANEPLGKEGAVVSFVGNLHWAFVLIGAEELVARRVWSGLAAWLIALVAYWAAEQWPSVRDRRVRKRQPAIQPSKLGLYDHAINMGDATARVTKLVTIAPDQFDRITDKVMSHATRMGGISDIREKRRRIDKLARDLGSDVQALEATANDLKSQCGLTISSYRELFTGVPIVSIADEAYLVGLSVSIRRAAGGFGGAVSALQKRREIMKGMSGKTEALTKIGDRCIAAITTMIEALDQLRAFADVEFPKVARKRVGRLKYWWMARRARRTTPPPAATKAQ